MTTSKKVFVAAAAIFLILLIFASYDISRRTTFPGSRSQLKERLKQTYSDRDTVKSDSLAPESPKN